MTSGEATVWIRIYCPCQPVTHRCHHLTLSPTPIAINDSDDITRDTGVVSTVHPFTSKVRLD